jgi:hypothetical protein
MMQSRQSHLKEERKNMLLGLHAMSNPLAENYPPQPTMTPTQEDKKTVSSSSTCGPNPTLGQGERARLLAMVQGQTKKVQNVFTTSGVVVGGLQTQPQHDPAVREQVATLLEQTLEKFKRADELLFGDEEPSSNGKQRLLKQLSAHLNKIKALTAQLNAPQGEGIEATEPASQTTLTAKEVDTSPRADKIVARCMEVLDALTPLCIAIDRPNDAGNSVLDHYFQVNEELPLGAELEKMLVHAALAQTVYADDLQHNLGESQSLVTKTLPEDWESMKIPGPLHGLFMDVCPKLKVLEDGRLCDPDSGLVMQMFENQKTRQVALAFGGTSAGEGKGPLTTRLLSNPWMTARQWRTNLSNATGISVVGGAVPDSFNRAASLAGLIEQFLNSGGDAGDWTVSLTGHSKGAAEAEYAALMNGLPAVCFGTPQLGKRVLETASAAQLEAGMRNIQHYFVEGDLAPKAGDLVAPILGRRQAHVGSGYWMKPASEVGSGPLKPLWCHDSFFPSALAEAERQKALPANNNRRTAAVDRCNT